MPTFKLDDRDIPFEPGDTVIRAAWRQGIEIPHYCWHPGLSIAANCRMCLVEVRQPKPMMLPILKWDEAKEQYVEQLTPKLVPACQQPAAEGMVVAAKSDPAKESQRAVHEFLLLNHPVDCPICDQAGECKLQDYWFEHQAELKRKHTEPVHKPKAERFGETIVYDAERCVMCTRCIRFCDEVVGDHVLDMRERANMNEIVLAPGRELDHKYTFMTEHVCPVGALTTRDFRFKARVWFLKATPSVCHGCATGCNDFIDHDPRNQRVYRLRPRDNMAVNKFWMCDDGMMSYHRFHHERQLVAEVLRGGARETVPVEDAIAAAAAALAQVEQAKVGVVLSAQHPSEDNFVLAKLARDYLSTQNLYLGALGGWDGDKILRHSDNNPNRAGAQQAAGMTLKPTAELIRDVEAGRVEAVLALGWATKETAQQLAPVAMKARSIVSLTTHIGALPELATVVLPVATHAEMSGTFVNAKGMAQTFKSAIRPPLGVRPAWEVLVDLARAMDLALEFKSLGDVHKAMPARASGLRPEVRA